MALFSQKDYLVDFTNNASMIFEKIVIMICIYLEEEL